MCTFMSVGLYLLVYVCNYLCLFAFLYINICLCLWASVFVQLHAFIYNHVCVCASLYENLTPKLIKNYPVWPTFLPRGNLAPFYLQVRVNCKLFLKSLQWARPVSTSRPSPLLISAPMFSPFVFRFFSLSSLTQRHTDYEKRNYLKKPDEMNGFDGRGTFVRAVEIDRLWYKEELKDTRRNKWVWWERYFCVVNQPRIFANLCCHWCLSRNSFPL